LGFGLGIGLALLLELLNRRVRGVEDINLSADIPCIGAVEEPRRPYRGVIDWLRRQIFRGPIEATA
jgi:hypothetical protein